MSLSSRGYIDDTNEYYLMSLDTSDCLSSDYLVPLLNCLGNCAMAEEEVLAGTSLVGQYPQPISGMLSIVDCEQIINNATAKLNQSPYMLGLMIGVSMRPTGFGQLGYVGMCSSTFDEALRQSSRFLGIVTPLMSFEYTEHEERVSLKIVESGVIREPVYGFLIGLFLGSLRALSLFLLGDRLFGLIDDSSVELKVDLNTYPDLAMLQSGPIKMDFGCEENCISFSKKLALQPLLNGNEVALRSAIMACERLLEETLAKRAMETQRVVVLVKQEIERYRSANPELDDVAQVLCLSPRTLSRQLKACDTSFSRLVIDARMGKAEILFQQGMLSIKEIAYQLGYSEVSNFSIAFKKYFGQSPSEFRGSLQI
ncbi:hypothetical protein A9Q99_19380 [Gammaproteobacteria bacterium 45_16_T64]|nr:hypothetical protein A9Q99_19380 [Gammaproteobacteria bacterium 45_16_T64]